MFFLPFARPLLAAALLACTAMLTNYAGLSPGAATNLAGRQRMLSQRMTKAYLCQALGINPAEAADELEKSKIQFETKLEILQAAAFDPVVNDALAREAAAWATFNALLSQPPTRESAQAVRAQNTVLLQACNAAVEHIVHYAQAHPELLVDTLIASPALQQELAPAINIAGRQRMLSQRMSAYYVAHLTGLSPAAIDEVLASARLFQDSLAILQKTPVNTPAILDGLKQVEQEWTKLFADPTQLRDKAIPASDFLAATSRILLQMDQLTLSYQQLAY